MGRAADVFLKIVAPVIGNILSSIMFVSPALAVLRIHRTGSLQELNPLPYPATVISCTSWIIYAAVGNIPTLYPCMLIGLYAGLIFTFVAMHASPLRTHHIMGAMLLAAGVLFSALAVVHTLAFRNDNDTASQMWGITGIILFCMYFIMPLSSLVTVVRTRNAASIYMPLAIATVVNGVLWAAYGFAIDDINIWFPDVLSIVLGMAQVALRLVYGARPSPRAALEAEEAAAAAEEGHEHEAADELEATKRTGSTSSSCGGTAKPAQHAAAGAELHGVSGPRPASAAAVQAELQLGAHAHAQQEAEGVARHRAGAAAAGRTTLGL